MKDSNAIGLVSDRLRDAEELRADFLFRAKKADSKAWQAGIDLDAQLQEDSKSWIEPSWDPDEAHEAALETAIRRAHSILENSTPRIQMVAMAMDWLRHDGPRWSERHVWRRAASERRDEERAELASIRREEIQLWLSRRGVTSEQIRTYFAALPDNSLSGPVDFPVEAPRLGQRLDLAADVATTHFIVRATAFDHTSLGAESAMEPDMFDDLDTSRLRPIVLEMLRREDGDNYIARLVLRQCTFDDYVDDILHIQQLVNPWAINALNDWQEPESSERRVRAIFRRARVLLSPAGGAILWSSTQRGGVFFDECIDEALTDLKTAEDSVKPEFDSKGGKDMDALRSAVRGYLSAAVRSRMGDPAGLLLAEDFRSWFRAHPRKDGGR